LRFSLDVRRARKGDCLLLHSGTKEKPGLVLIDGGPSNVYKPHLRPRIEQIRKARKLGPQSPLTVDLLMVSHVDDDHIRGILDLTAELNADQGGTAPLLRILSLWHNSFDDVIGKDPKELTAAVAGQFGAASLGGELPADATLDSHLPEEIVRDNLQVLASIEQGHRLRGDAEALGLELNPQFGGRLILPGAQAVDAAPGVKFRVVGPLKPELQALQRKHDEWLKEQKEQKKKSRDHKAALAAYVDASVPNLSSIVVLAEAGKKRMLLTGDARGDKIIDGLESAGILKKGKALHVDILKVPHHGSANNVETDFFARITADHYVFSGDGEHGNPERETLEMLFAARGKQPLQIHLTYPIAEIDAERKLDWGKEQAKEKKLRAAGGKNRPRANWSAVKHSLKAFFKGRKLAAGQKLHTIEHDTAPHVIDLLDPLGF
jgi:hypothetical protein